MSLFPCHGTQVARTSAMRRSNRRSATVNREDVLAVTSRAGGSGLASFCSVAIVFGILGGLFAPEARADTHTTGVPQLSSSPGAPYTIYLDFAGFNFTGSWGSSGETPGNTPAFENAGREFHRWPRERHLPGLGSRCSVLHPVQRKRNHNRPGRGCRTSRHRCPSSSLLRPNAADDAHGHRAAAE